MPGRDGLPDFAGWTQQQVADFWAQMNQYLNARGAQVIGTAFAPPDERGKPAQVAAEQARQAARAAGDASNVTVSAGETRQANAPYDPSQTWAPGPQAVVLSVRGCNVCPVCAQPLLLP